MIHLSEVVPVTDLATVALRIPARQSWPLMSMQTANYLNLDILFHRDGDHYTVRARNSVGSESSRAQSFMVPFTPQEREMLTGDMPDPGYLNVTPQQVGQRLYEALFQGEIRDLLVRSHEQARTLAGLRLRLHLNDTAELALLPWEYLYDAKEARFLALTARLSIVRYLALGEPPQALQVDPPLRVLVVLANPTDIFPQLDVAAEWQQLQTVLAPLVDQGIVELIQLPQPTRNALADHLEQYPVHVLHFVGHGNHDAASGEGGLYLVNEAGAADFVPASVLQVLLADTRDRRNALRLAFLNGCLTGRSAQVDPFAGTAQQLVQHGVPAVIAMQYSVTDGAATELAHRFYRALARSYPVDAALAQARKGIYIQGNYLEWGTPVLFLRAPDGQLFTVAGAEKLSPLLPDVECPYRGLEVFEAEHAPFYFGRENMIQRLLAKVAETNFIAVVGPSGSGKSSLVRAGLIPALAKGALTGSAQWAVAMLRPGSDPIRSLISALLQLGDPQTDYASRIAEVRRLANMLMADELPLADLLDPLNERHSGLLLVVDQFEEAFNPSQNLQMRTKFFTALLVAATHDRVKVILTLRADFWGHMLDDKELGKPADAGQINVLAMTRNERCAAVENPAQAVGRHFEKGLVSLILDELETEPGELPLLEFALTELWERQSVEGVFTHSSYLAIGKVGGAIARRADEILQQLNEYERHKMRTLFTRLVRVARPEEGTQDTKQRIPLNEVDEETQALVQRLASARLLVTGTDSETGEPQIEIAHEALIRRWQVLKEWLNSDREYLLWRQRLRVLQESWQRSGKGRDGLLSGALLNEAEVQAENHIYNLDSQEQAYITISRLAEDERLATEIEAQQRELKQAQQLVKEANARRKAEEERAREAEIRRYESDLARIRLRRSTFILTGVALVAVIATLFSTYQTRRVTARSLAAQSLTLMSDGDFHLAALVALEAQRLDKDVDDRVLQSIPYQRTYLDTNTILMDFDTANNIAWSPDGRILAIGASNGNITLWDMQSDKQLRTLSTSIGNINAIAWSPDGHTLASGIRIPRTSGGVIVLWDTSTGQQIRTLSGTNGFFTKISWSSDGRSLISDGFDQHLSIWDTQTGDLIRTTIVRDWETSDWNLHPNGYLLAIGTHEGNVVLWNSRTDEFAQTSINHKDSINSLVWSPDGKFIIAATFRNISLWNMESGKALLELDEYIGSKDNLAWSLDGDTIAFNIYELNYRKSRIILLNSKNGEQVAELEGHRGQINNIAWNPGSSYYSRFTLATSATDGRVILWDPTSSKELLVLDGNYGSISSLAWSPSGKLIATTANQDVILWDSQSGEQLRVLESHSIGLSRSINSVVWSPDEQTIAAGGNNRGIIFWNAKTGKQTRVIGDSDRILSLAWSPDGQTLAAGTSSSDVKLWNAQSGEQLQVMDGHVNRVESVAWSPDGQIIASSSIEPNIILWDAKNGKKLDVLQLEGTSMPIKSLSWSPNGHTLATGSLDNRMILWDIKNGNKSRVFDTGYVESISWNPNGQTIAANSGNGVSIWDISNGKFLYTLKGHRDYVSSVAWSPDGQILASGAFDGQIHLRPAEYMGHACSWLSYNMNITEWQEYRPWSIYRPACPNLPSSSIPSVITIMKTRNYSLLFLSYLGWIIMISIGFISASLFWYTSIYLYQMFQRVKKRVTTNPQI